MSLNPPIATALWSCRVPWGLSYVVLAHAMVTLALHYRSYAMLRVAYLRFGPMGLHPVPGEQRTHQELSRQGGRGWVASMQLLPLPLQLGSLVRLPACAAHHAPCTWGCPPHCIAWRVAGEAPRQAILGFKPRGWRHAKHTLLRLVSAYHVSWRRGAPFR